MAKYTKSTKQELEVIKIKILVAINPFFHPFIQTVEL